MTRFASSVTRFVLGAILGCGFAAGAAAQGRVPVYLPSGSFVMGGPGDDSTLLADELPRHAAAVGAMYVESLEVTKALWDAVRDWALTNGYTDLPAGQGGGSTNGAGGTEQPVAGVSWYDAVKWCNARSEMENLGPVYLSAPAPAAPYRIGEIDLSAAHLAPAANGYRLPTEAEWERAARGGLSGALLPWGGTNGLASDWATAGDAAFAGSGTRPPGSYPPNGFGLYDMAGNVAEWCWDWFDTGYYGSYPTNAWPADPAGPPVPPVPALRVVRGGGWADPAEALRCGCRDGDEPGRRRDGQGFRVVRGFAGNELLDVDGDGMPDWWEYLHFGGATNAVATADGDGDGLWEREEYLLGRNPHDPASAFDSAPAVLAEAGFLVTWPAIAGYTYDVLHTEALDADFAAAATNLPATPPLNTYTARVDQAASGFFRVRMRRP